MKDKEYFYKEDYKTAKKKFKMLCTDNKLEIIKSNGEVKPLLIPFSGEVK